MSRTRAAYLIANRTKGQAMYDFMAHGYTAIDIENAIDIYIVGKNAARNRQILKDRFIDGLTINDLADKYLLSESQIKLIISRCGKYVYDNL